MFVSKLIIMMIERRNKAHAMLKNLINTKLYTRKEIAEILNISYPTFITRFENVEWRAKEVDLIFDKFINV